MDRGQGSIIIKYRWQIGPNKELGPSPNPNDGGLILKDGRL